MANKSQITRANRMLEIIKRDGSINKFDLMDICGLSLANYNQLAGWFTHRYQDTLQMVEYDKQSKRWIWQKVKKHTPQKRIDEK